MKMLIILMMTFAFGLNNGGDDVVTYKADTERSVLKWEARKVTGKHDGTVKLKEGVLNYENDMLVGGTFTMDMTSITVTDLSGNMKNKLEGHLKSPDFFSVEEFPNATFEITEVVSRGMPGEYKVIGDLTIKGITKEIKFNTKIDETQNERTASATMTIDRSEFDVRYGSGSFFDNLGDKTIYDDFDIEVMLVTNK